MNILLLAASAFLAFSNGANDNFKGVATLFGSGSSDYRRALNWACWTTFAGSLTAIWFSQKLLQTFSGKGLVPPSLVGSSALLISVSLGAALTVMIATVVGLPVSTTHALTGSLVGAALALNQGSIAISKLGSLFLVPLLLSPLLAVALAGALYLVLHSVRLGVEIDKETCICVGNEIVERIAMPVAGETRLRPAPILSARIGSMQQCRQEYLGRFLGIPAASLLHVSHYISAGAVSFARGLNDTPKIAALLFTAHAVAPAAGFGLVAFFMAAGGWIAARRVAETMSHKITPLNPGQGFSANVATAVLVIGASGLGLPVSTTHVSTGSLFGIGWLAKTADPRIIRSILFAWLGTLPMAAGLAALLAFLLQ